MLKILSFLLIVSFCEVAEARIAFVEYTTMTVNGVTYDVPIASSDYKQKYYWVKKALDGDKTAYDLVEHETFIGEHHARWLIKDGVGGFYVKDFEVSGAEPAKSAGSPPRGVKSS